MQSPLRKGILPGISVEAPRLMLIYNGTRLTDSIPWRAHTYCADLWPRSRSNWNRKDCMRASKSESKQIVNKSEITLNISLYIYHIYIYLGAGYYPYRFRCQFHLAICTWQYRREREEAGAGAGAIGHVWCRIHLHWTLESRRILYS